MDSIIKICSFDIGLRNMGHCIECITMQQIIDGNICDSNIDLVYIKNIDFGEGPFSFSKRNKIIKYLDDNIDIFSSCDTILIEQQYSYRGTGNIKAIRMMELLITFLLLKCKGTHVQICSAHNKTYILNAPKLKTKHMRKKWAVQKCKEILSARDDDNSLDIIEKYKKQDDISDAFLQLQAWKLLMRYEYKI